jgi:hypothetical protein
MDKKHSVMKKGGMSCSCGGKGCMKCGGKKYQDGGKKKAKVSKTNFVNPSNMTYGTKTITSKSKNGKLVTRTSTKTNLTDGKGKDTYKLKKNSTTVTDTTGYAAGKKSFPVKKATKDYVNGKEKNSKYTTGKISRKGVKTLFKKGGTKK